MYIGDRTGRALRDINSMVGSIPVNNAKRGLLSAQAEGQNLQNMVGLRRAELALPGEKLAAQEAERDLAIHNAPVNVRQLIGEPDPLLVKNGYALNNPPDQLPMWLKARNVPGYGPVPAPIDQAFSNIQNRYGYVPNKEGILVDKEGKPLPNYMAGDVFKEFRRVKGLNADPVEANNMKVLRLESSLESGKVSDEDAKAIRGEIDRLKSLDPVEIRQRYVTKLKQIQEEDKGQGRKSGFMNAMIEEQLGHIDRARAGAAEASKRQHEMDLVDRRNAGSLAAARAKDGGLDYATKQQIDDTSAAILDAQKQLAKGTMINQEGMEVPMTPEYQARLMAHIGSLQGQLQQLQGGGAAQPKPSKISRGYGNRADGTQKGPGFMGEIKTPDGGVSTEISIGVELDGKETEIPTLVPTLTKDEITYLVGGGTPTDAIVKKAVDHAKKRIEKGLSPFKSELEENLKPFSPSPG